MSDHGKLDVLLEQYWNAAYAEGAAGLTHDTADLVAQLTLNSIHEELEKQLAERDAALARCGEELEAVASFCSERGHDKAADHLYKMVASLPTSTQATAKVLAAAQETQEKYNELLYGVSIKHPNETRHETALRYIRQAEYPQNTVACEAIREEKEGK